MAFSFAGPNDCALAGGRGYALGTWPAYGIDQRPASRYGPAQRCVVRVGYSCAPALPATIGGRTLEQRGFPRASESKVERRIESFSPGRSVQDTGRHRVEL